MLLTKSIKIIINNGNLPRYKSFDEFKDIKKGDEIDIPMKYISKGMRKKVLVKCDICGKERNILYSTYNSSTKNQTEIYTCRGKCSNIKREKTNIELYDVKNCFQNAVMKEKSKKTMQEKYGHEYNMQCEQFKENRKETYLENWGVDNPTKSNILKEQISKKMLDNQLKIIEEKYDNLKIINNENNTYTISGNCHTFDIIKSTFYQRLYHNITLCTICNPINSHYSDKENKLYNFIKSNYEGEIITSDRKIMKPYELDIYLPELKLAFEFNGVYWHNELYKDKNYHINKTENCLEQGIQLFHIWEDDWNYKQDIIKSMLLNKLGKTPNKIYARKTKIKEINDNKLIKIFLDKNHLQGFVGSKVKLGLYYEDELVSLMTFGKKRLIMNSKSNNDSEYELLRFCNKINTNIIGGASKLFKYFVKNYNPKEITTYADRSHSQGNLYDMLGFKKLDKTIPNYHYVIDGIRKHRFGFRKDVLVKQGFDKNMTEHEIMFSRNIYRIYDSGNMKYIYYS